MFRIININGNVEMLRELFTYYETLYTDMLTEQTEISIN